MDPSLRTVKIWDLPVRLFHWTLVLLLGFLFWSGKTGGNAMEFHLYAGYLVLALVIFRVLWGFLGSTFARFSGFLAGPARTLAFARRLASRGAAHVAGHNPLGGWMVVVMLASLLVQAGTGLFANDDIAIEGPLFALVSKATSDRLSGIHVWNFNLLLVLAGLHVAAVLFHVLVKKENLVAAMFSGERRLDDPAACAASAPGVRFVSPWWALGLFLLALAVVILIVKRPF
ncbi:MAG: cytochrome b/b6 domain-containing protein [Betaproteobacteria bacterium]